MCLFLIILTLLPLSEFHLHKGTIYTHCQYISIRIYLLFRMSVRRRINIVGARRLCVNAKLSLSLLDLHIKIPSLPCIRVIYYIL
jgi:hypothetical protein